MRVLIVGAGSVGQVFGHHLRRAGADVTFLVRPKYADEVVRGFDLRALRRWRSSQPVELREFDVVTTVDDVSSRAFDQVYLTIPSTGLEGGWLADFVAATGDATVVTFPSGPDGSARLRASGLSEDRTVEGLLSLIAYAVPLPDDTDPRHGTAFWLPPLAPLPLSGPRERTDAIVRTLERGGLRARRQRDVARTTAFGSAAVQVWLAALESAHWSFAELFSGEASRRAALGVREAHTILAESLGPRRAQRFVLTRRRLLSWLVPIAAWAVPFPLEPYVRQHFTKVREQTRHTLRTLVARGDAAGLPTHALHRLSEDGP